MVYLSTLRGRKPTATSVESELGIDKIEVNITRSPNDPATYTFANPFDTNSSETEPGSIKQTTCLKVN